MTVGMLFLLLALILFFFEGLGATFVPKAIVWGFFCLTLGLLTGGIPFLPWTRP